jgi:hypothetical protein
MYFLMRCAAMPMASSARLVARLRPALDLAHVVDAAQAQQPALAVQEVVQGIDGQPQLAAQIEHDRRVDVPACGNP